MNDSSPRASLLIVEDSRIQAKILSDKLLEAGYQVRTAENGQIGLEMIREQPPTLVISDIEMPVMNGYQLCHAVKNDPDLRRIPFILLSTLADAQDIIKGLHCGADNYVTKPYDPKFLISRVASLLETPLAEDEEEQQLDVTLGGTQYTVKAGRQQVLNLLVSTFENAVEKNQELVRTNEELTVAKEQLTRWNDQLESLNNQLDSSNQRMTRDLDAAAKVQRSLLPSSNPKTSLVNFSWKFIPCDELAGDFLNYFALDEDHIAIYVVDVSGHGVASSLLSVTIGRLMTPLVSSSSLLVQSDGNGQTRIVPPREVAFELNRRFPMEEQNELFFTMLYGVLKLSTLELQYVSAGHDPIVHVRKGELPKMLEGTNMAIGWVEDMEYDQEAVTLAPGDRLYAYSDGVPEAMDEGLNQFSMQQMMEMIELGQSQSLEQSVSLLEKSVQRWCAKNGPKDDVSILGLEIASDS
ncbi:Response regulator PleD [Roseimaritima multifibrata]|uniref:Response regulator PleD n=1 Tax=Roseimaritima multifibrata TaxID=1930274 RepID=A0A517MIA9_9BACT|nr:SpoIIE family protein phosphatase [Roseimaritima multifibrata]QDS94600.1 Response regulator PleD [Roseimaritima multifibrata]